MSEEIFKIQKKAIELREKSKYSSKYKEQYKAIVKEQNSMHREALADFKRKYSY